MAQQTVTLHGIENGQRVQSRILEERIQRAVNQGARDLHIEAYGQHGIGGRLWVSREEPIHVRITGSPGQRRWLNGVLPFLMVSSSCASSASQGGVSALCINVPCSIQIALQYR